MFYGIGADSSGSGDGTTTFNATEDVGVACAFHLRILPLLIWCYSSLGFFSIGCDAFIDNLKIYSSAG